MDTIEKMVAWFEEKYYYLPLFMVVYMMMR